ncbi:MAG: ATP-binding cassette domain-containing protein [Planctomycetota bacterium]
MADAISSTSRSDAPPPGGVVVACQNLSKVFKDFWMRDRARAVDGLSFEIRQHEIFGLLGPNGSGKSTTIKMILGLLRPTKGRLVVFGKSPTDVATKKRIGYLPEESYLYQFLNARETLDYYGKLFQLDRRTRQRRIDELLDMVGLTAAQFRPVREYSKGMQRRIGLAQALINDPDLLILDEPTTGLDPIGTRQVKDLIIELGRRGKTVLLSSHLLADVEDCVDRMVILYGGRTRAEGARDELLMDSNHLTLQTDQLDDETIAEIDAVIRRRTGGAVQKVAKPRQTLESLFLDIVESARAERITTSGATSGGATAAFLRSDDETGEGDALIDRLVRGKDDPGDDGEMPRETTPETCPAAGAEADEDNAVLDALIDPVAPADPEPTPDDQLLRMVERMETDAAGEPRPDAEPGLSPSPETSKPKSQAPTPPAASGDEVDTDLISSLLKEPDDEDPRP